jgi:hypothetical protein
MVPQDETNICWLRPQMGGGSGGSAFSPSSALSAVEQKNFGLETVKILCFSLFFTTVIQLVEQ